MIPIIQLWRVRIGLFDAKCHSGSRSSSTSSVLLEKSVIPSMTHSPICDSSPEPSTTKHVPSSNHDEHKRAFSAENSSEYTTVLVDTCTKQQQSVDRKIYLTRKLGSKTVYSLHYTDMLYLPSDLLRDAVVMLLIVSQLLVLSGDIETNPGPIASEKPTMNQLISLKLTNGSGKYLRIIRWIASLDRDQCLDFAYLLLDDPVKVDTHQKISSTDGFVRAVLRDWLYSGDGITHTWAALAECMEEAGLPGVLVKAIRLETCSSSTSSPQEDVNAPAMKPTVPSLSCTGKKESVEVEPEIPKKLLVLNQKYSDMLVVLQTTKLSNKRLHRLKLFLSDYCDEQSLKDCPSSEQIIDQLKAKLKIHIYNIDTLTACCNYFGDSEVSQSIEEYKQHLNTFLSTTSVKEFQSSLQSGEFNCFDDTEPLTLKLNETASNDTLMNLKKLVYHFFGHSSKTLIISNIHNGCVCVTWAVPVSLVSTFRAKAQQLSTQDLARRGVLELVIGIRIAPYEARVDDADVFHFDKTSLDSQRFEEQQHMMVAAILKQKESEFETERKERLEKCEKLELELKEKSDEMKILQEKLALDSQRFGEQQNMMVAAILKRKENEFETERKEQLWLEEKCDKLELELKEKSNEMKILQEKLAAVLKSDEALPVQSEAHHYRAGGSSSAESEALKHLFSYLVNSIDTAALIPAGLRRDLITNHQKLEYYNETDPYKKAEMFLSHLQQAVNADYDNYHTFVQILKQTSQLQIAFRLRDELAHSFRSMQQLSASSSTDEGEQVKLVPDSLVEELAGLRSAFARLLRNYEEQLQSSSEAQNEFVKFLPRLFHRAVDNHSFQSHFNTLLEEEVSLFNIFYLKQLCGIFPEDVRATTRQLVDEYEQQCQHFMTCATVSQFKQLFPATATSSKLSKGKVNVELKVKSYWDESTLDDLTKLVALFDVSGNHLHLSKVENGCSAVTWLCSIIEVKQLNMAIVDKTDSLQSMGVLQVFVGKELVLESPMSHFSATAPVEISPLEGPSDKSSGVQTNEFMTTSLPSATKSYKPITAVHLVPQVTDIEYQCPICLEVFTDEVTPYLTDCGHHLCGMCCDRMRKTSKKECPTCRKPDMLKNARCDNYFQRLVKNLKVRCSDYEEGCEWEGELKDLNDHLERQCGIACPFGCGKYARSSDMKEHTRHCHNRMISCENCGYYNTFTIVTEQHYPICPQSTSPAITSATASPQYLYNHEPIEFTIGDFSEKKRINEEWLSSNFYAHNGDYKFNLNVYPNGISDGIRSHLSVHTKLMSGKQPFEGDIQIELLNWKEDKNHHSATICFNRHNHTVYRVTSKETGTRSGQPDQFISHTDMAPTTDTKYLLGDFFKLRVSVAVYSTPIPPMIPSWMTGPREATPLSSHDDSQPIIAQFTISEFSMRKKFNNMYFSEPFTTSPQGYKFSIKAMANGCRSGKGSNITMSAIIMKGQHDDHLKWPFTGTIIIEVLNWLEDKGHHKQVFSIDPNDGLVRVTKGEYGRDFGFFKFISHASLLLDSFANTQYLYEDCICVRVRKSRTAGD